MAKTEGNTRAEQQQALLKGRNVDPTQLINWFDDFGDPNPYCFLSNFYEGAQFDMGDGYGDVWRTGEHAFQAYKATTFKDFRKINRAVGPARAKAEGRSIKLRRDWEAVKYDVMRAVLAAKFAPGRWEADMLLSTGDAYLLEGTDWNDRVWGVNNSNGRGRNWLGELLMARRAHLRSGIGDVVNPTVLGFALPDLEGR